MALAERLDRIAISRGPVMALFVLAVVAVATISLTRLAHDVDPRAIPRALSQLPFWRIAAALVCTGISHLLLTLYDVLALRTVGARLPWRVAARAAFTSYTLSHNLGFGALTGGSARLRIYGEAGLKPRTVAQIVVIAGTAFWGGVIAVAMLCLLVTQAPVTIAGLVMTPASARIAGAGAALLTAAAILLLRANPRLRAAVTRIVPLPSAPLAMLLVGTAAFDLAFAALALVVLVPGPLAANFPELYLAYALAVIAGLLTHVPGGIGVFEAVFLSALPETGSPEIAALIAYRAIYYLLPLAGSVVLNAVIEARGLARMLRPALRSARAIGDEIGPPLLAAMSFGGGLVLLLSGALPAVSVRMHLLVDVVPLPFIEASHMAASLVGTGLLLVAPALAARLDRGMRAARVLFLLGAVFSLAKGLDIEEAAVMLGMAGLLQIAAPAFYREARGAFSVPSIGWLIAALIGLILTTVSGVVAYRHIPYGMHLWWQFCLHGDAPRFLRASFATGVLIAGFALRLALGLPRAVSGPQALPDEVFKRASAASARSDAALALTGDKRFLINAAGDAFLMFRTHGASCIVMGDPVGPRESWRDLVWDLRRLADRSGARLCFYQLSAEMLPLIIDLGLKPIKYGEEAHIALAGFALAGSRMKSLRNGHARGAREGLRLAVVPARDADDWIASLRIVSDAWLAAHGAAEKSFSLGRFDPAYLRRFDLAVVIGPGGEPLAFANLWHSGDGCEISVDLMRQHPQAPPGTMDFLFVELLRHAGKAGAIRFNLGMAPLSGMHAGKLAPIWARLAHLAFSVESGRYNFAGLRRYKEKFAPQWESRFIATPPGLSGWRSMLDLMRLINDGRHGEQTA